MTWKIENQDAVLMGTHFETLKRIQLVQDPVVKELRSRALNKLCTIEENRLRFQTAGSMIGKDGFVVLFNVFNTYVGKRYAYVYRLKNEEDILAKLGMFMEVNNLPTIPTMLFPELEQKMPSKRSKIIIRNSKGWYDKRTKREIKEVNNLKRYNNVQIEFCVDNLPKGKWKIEKTKNFVVCCLPARSFFNTVERRLYGDNIKDIFDFADKCVSIEQYY